MAEYLTQEAQAFFEEVLALYEVSHILAPSLTRRLWSDLSNYLKLLTQARRRLDVGGPVFTFYV
jgi:hypothetical protein